MLFLICQFSFFPKPPALKLSAWEMFNIQQCPKAWAAGLINQVGTSGTPGVQGLNLLAIAVCAWAWAPLLQWSIQWGFVLLKTSSSTLPSLLTSSIVLWERYGQQEYSRLSAAQMDVASWMSPLLLTASGRLSPAFSKIRNFLRTSSFLVASFSSSDRQLGYGCEIQTLQFLCYTSNACSLMMVSEMQEEISHNLITHRQLSFPC